MPDHLSIFVVNVHSGTTPDALFMSALKFGHSAPVVVSRLDDLHAAMHNSTSTVALVLQVPQAVIMASPDTFLQAYRALGGAPRLVSSTTSPFKAGVVDLKVVMGPPQLLSETLTEEKDHSHTFYGVPELATTIKSQSADIMLPKLLDVKHVVHENGNASISVNGHKSMVLLLPNQRTSILNYYAYRCGVSDDIVASYTPYLECGVIWFLISVTIIVLFTTTMWLVTRHAVSVERTKKRRNEDE